MSLPQSPRPALEQIYHRYLDDGNAASLVRSVSERYTFATLARLAEFGDHLSRRASVLAVSYMGDYQQNGILGRALRDRDRGVRMIADNGIRQLWRRHGNVRRASCWPLCAGSTITNCTRKRSRPPVRSSTKRPGLPRPGTSAASEIALQDFEASANDCHQTLELNPYHFGAAVGIAHCYLEMNDPFAALESFRRALRLNPDLEDVRVQIDYLQRALKGK